MAEFIKAPWCVPTGSEICVCEGDDPSKPGKILFVLRGPQGTRESYPYELLGEYNVYLTKAVNSHEALVKALKDIRFISEDPIGLTEREQIQKLCNAALASIEVQP